MSERPFRVSFPVITTPVNLGAKRAILLFAVGIKGDPKVQFCTCLDIDGKLHQQVPLHINALKAAMIKPANFQEVRELDGPGIVVVPS